MSLTLTRLGEYVPDRGAGRTLALVTFVDSIGTGLYLTGAAIFFVRSIGLSVAQVGLGLSVGAAVGFATTVPVGLLGDRLGPRRLLVIVQLWRAGCLTALVFVSGVVTFTLVAAVMAIAEAATPSLTQAVVGAAVDGERRVATMAILRSTRNAGFSIGAVLAAPLIAAGAFGVIMFGDALSFVFVAVALARLPLVRAAGARPRAGGLVRDWRYAGLAAVNGVLTLHMTILAFGLPLWLLRATSAPASLVAVLMLINTIMAVVLQVPFSKQAATPAGATRTLRLAGIMLAGCSLAMAAAAHGPLWVAVAMLIVATGLMSLGEIWQAAGAWELSYRYADPAREVQYLAVFSLGATAQDVLAPALVTGVIIMAGPAGWVGLAAVFLAATLLVGPATSALENARKEKPCVAPTG
jgi:MFS family permease